MNVKQKQSEEFDQETKRLEERTMMFGLIPEAVYGLWIKIERSDSCFSTAFNSVYGNVAVWCYVLE